MNKGMNRGMNRLAPSRLFHRLRHARIENKGLKALSLLLAILLFVVSRQPMTDVQVAGVRIEFRGLNPGVEISGVDKQTVSVRLKGPRDIVRSLAPNELVVVADLGNKEPGERSVQLKADESFLPDNVKVERIDPPSIKIKLEPTMSKRVKVEAHLAGQIPKGREIYRVRLVPAEIEIEGPESLISKSDHVRTETVNLDGRGANFQTSVEVEVQEDSLRVKSQGPIELSVDIGQERLRRRFANIPVRWIDKNSTGVILTKTVNIEVFGPKSAVEALRADDLRVEVKTTGLPPDTNNLTPQVLLPANIEVKNVSPKEVKVKR